MSAFQQVAESVDDLVTRIGRDSLQALRFLPMDASDYMLKSRFSQVSAGSGPGLLPLAWDDDETLCLYVRPGRPLDQSGVVLVDGERRNFVCHSVGELPTAALLFQWSYVPNDSAIKAAGRMCEGMVGRRAPSPELIDALRSANPRLINRLFAEGGDPTPQRLWALSGIAHPFLGMLHLPSDDHPVEEAAAYYRKLSDERPDVPERLAVALAAEARSGRAASIEDALRVLSSEAWWCLHQTVRGMWRLRGERLAEWDATMQALRDAGRLRGTPFESLADHPRAYRGEGVEALVEIADRFVAAGNLEGALTQLRNAEVVSILADVDAGDLTARQIAILENLEPGGPAHLLALASQEVRGHL